MQNQPAFTGVGLGVIQLGKIKGWWSSNFPPFLSRNQESQRLTTHRQAPGFNMVFTKKYRNGKPGPGLKEWWVYGLV